MLGGGDTGPHTGPHACAVPLPPLAVLLVLLGHECYVAAGTPDTLYALHVALLEGGVSRGAAGVSVRRQLRPCVGRRVTPNVFAMTGAEVLRCVAVCQCE
jgi:hypothetical protein